MARPARILVVGGGNIERAPDGSWVGGGPPVLAPDGS